MVLHGSAQVTIHYQQDYQLKLVCHSGIELRILEIMTPCHQRQSHTARRRHQVKKGGIGVGKSDERQHRDR